MSFCVFHAVQLGGLQSQLGGLQSTLAKLQAEQDDPEQACADQGLTDDECILYIKSLGGRIRSVQTQIASVQTQVANVQQGLTAQGCPTSPIVGADGAPLTVEADSQGHITSAEAVGNDGVKRTFKRTFTYEPGEKGGNWYYGVLRQEYFENDQRYLYATSWSFLWG